MHSRGALAPPLLTPSNCLPTHQARHKEVLAWGAWEDPPSQALGHLAGAFLSLRPRLQPLGTHRGPGFSGPLRPPPPSASTFPKAPSCLPRLSLRLGAGVGEAVRTARFTAEETEAQGNSMTDLRWRAVAGPAPFSSPTCAQPLLPPPAPWGLRGSGPERGALGDRPRVSEDRRRGFRGSQKHVGLHVCVCASVRV